MRPFKGKVALIAGSCVAAAIVFGAKALLAHREGSAHTLIQSAAILRGGGRVYYPSSNPPVIVLPDGTTKRVKSILNPPSRLKYGEFYWNETNIPQGEVWIRVDLKNQIISIFRAYHEIGTAVVLYGAADKESPTGTFAVLQKAADYHSRTYDAPMPFMLRITSDGVAIHGSTVRGGAATHGCIGVPTEFARRLFDQVKVGDTVVIVKQTQISH